MCVKEGTYSGCNRENEQNFGPYWHIPHFASSLFGSKLLFSIQASRTSLYSLQWQCVNMVPT